MTTPGLPPWMASLPAVLGITTGVLAIVLDEILDRRLARFLRERTKLSAEAITEVRRIASDRVLQVTCITTLSALVLSIWPLRHRFDADALALVAIAIAIICGVMLAPVLIAEPGTLSGIEWFSLRGVRISRFNVYMTVCLLASAVAFIVAV